MLTALPVAMPQERFVAQCWIPRLRRWTPKNHIDIARHCNILEANWRYLPLIRSCEAVSTKQPLLLCVCCAHPSLGDSFELEALPHGCPRWPQGVSPCRVLCKCLFRAISSPAMALHHAYRASCTKTIQACPIIPISKTVVGSCS